MELKVHKREAYVKALALYLTGRYNILQISQLCNINYYTVAGWKASQEWEEYRNNLPFLM